MSELRKDPISGRWVILAPGRMRRPNDFQGTPGGLCPFCAGHEDLTPPEIAAVREAGSAPNGPGWSIRVVPNQFPALQVENESERRRDGLLEQMAGLGAHEVVIESPRHEPDLGDMTDAEVEAILWMWSERLRDLSQDIRLQSVSVFRNRGSAAGASLQHPHSQIIVLPLVPEALAQEIGTGLRHFQENQRCLYCDLIDQERKDGARIVLENEGALALVPWAPRAPFETWIMPVPHAGRFEREPRSSLASVAAILRETLRRISAALEKPAYNVMLQTAPLRSDDLPHFHWRLEIVPAVTKPAGFEWGTGCYINPVSPEEAAAFLRKTHD